MSTAEWGKKFQDHLNSPPGPDTLLRAYGDQCGAMWIQLEEGKEPFIYCRVFVPQIVGCQLGWYLQGFDEKQHNGMRCILMPKSACEVMRRMDMEVEKHPIRALRVINISTSGKALLCEIAEWCDEDKE